jgi:hypothetical protein
MQFQVELNPRLISESEKVTEPAIVPPDERSAQHFEINVRGTR